MAMRLPTQNMTDPIAAIVGATILILVNAGVVERLGLTAEQVANIGAGVITLAATVRSLTNRRSADRRARPEPETPEQSAA